MPQWAVAGGAPAASVRSAFMGQAIGSDERKRGTIHSILLKLAMVAACGAVVYVGFRAAHDVGRALKAIGDFRPGFVALAAGCELVGLMLAGEALWRLQGRPTVIARPIAQAASLVNLSLGAIMPAAPVEGFTLSFFELRRRGLPQRRAGLALAWGQWLQARAFVMLAAASAIAVVAFGELPGRLTTYVWLGVGGAAIFLGGTWLLTSRPKPLAAIASALAWALPLKATPEEVRATIHRLHGEAHDLLGRGHERHISWLMISLGPLASGTSLWLVLLASSHPISVEEALMAGAVAILSSWVPFVPGGIGVAETTVTVVLHLFGVPVPEALAVALVWRAMTLVAPALTGLIALGLLRIRRRVKGIDPATTDSPDVRPGV